MGKTTTAKMLVHNSAMIVKHKDNLKHLNVAKHLAIIFDDMGFTHYSRESCIGIVDMEHEMHFDVKGGMVKIPANVVRIFTSNYCPETVFNYSSSEN